MNIPQTLTVLIIFVAVPINWFVCVLLWRLSRSHSPIRVLRERAIVATALSIIVTVFGLIFLNNDQVPPPLDFETTKLFTRGVLFVMATLPALYFLHLWRKAAR